MTGSQRLHADIAGQAYAPQPHLQCQCNSLSTACIAAPHRATDVVRQFALYDVDGSVMRAGAVRDAQVSHYGIELHFHKLPSQVAPGQELLLVLSVDPYLWPDTRKFPCGPSQYTDDPSSCDFVITGWPTKAGEREYLAEGAPAAYCCPRGIMPFGSASQFDSCMCNDELAQAPYKVTAEGITRSGSTTFSYALRAVAPSQPPLFGQPSCARMSIDAVRMYVDLAVAERITQVVFLEAVWTDFKVVNDSSATWLEIYNLNLPHQEAGCLLPFSVQVAGAALQLCASDAGAYSPECEYQVFGAWDSSSKEFSCCPRGDSITALPQLPAESCDSNVAHSPRTLSYQSLGGDDEGTYTSLTFRLEEDLSACIVAGAAAPACCGSDLKAIFIQLRSRTEVVGVEVSPRAAISYSWVNSGGISGVNITGTFAGSYTVTVNVAGVVGLEDVASGADLGHGTIYRLYGGADPAKPYGCCPSYWTDDAMPTEAVHYHLAGSHNR